MEYEELTARVLIGNAIRHLRDVMKPLQPEDKLTVFKAVVVGYCPLCGEIDDECVCHLLQ